ncbi:MAG: ABC transporter permease [Chloroflexota bacterium]
MNGLLRLLWKECFETIKRPIAPGLIVLLSVVVVWTSGKLNVEKPTLNIVLLTQGATRQTIDDAKAVIGEFANTTVSEVKGDDELVEALERPGTHLAVVRQNQKWVALDRQPTRGQEEDLTRVATLVGWSLNAGRPWFTESLDFTNLSEKGKNESSAPADEQNTQIFNPIWVGRLSALPGEPQLLFVPRTIGLITVFIAFVIAVRNFSREVTYRTLHVLLSAPIGGWRTIITAKLTASTWLATMIFLLLLLSSRSIFGITPKAELMAHLGIQVVAILTSVCLGIIAALAARTQSQVFVSMAVYFLGLVLLSGFLFPLETAAPIVRVASILSPLTFSNPILERWLFYGASIRPFAHEAIALGLQLAVAIMLLFASILIARRSV